jgi:predicted enzyme related to lactoylglutathione lyase
MSTLKSYDPGDFSWVDLSTTNLGGAIEFYGSFFGWTTEEQTPSSDDMHKYVMCFKDGQVVCGMGELPASMAENGVPPHWNSYIATNDIDAWCQKAKELGGNVQMGPFTIGQHGKMAMIQDPTGGVVGLWQAIEHQGAQRKQAPGSLCWNELATNDPEKAATFYAGVCGWEHSTKDMGATSYTTFSLPNGGESMAGAIKMTEEWGDTPPHWMPYFAVEECDKEVKRAEELGAKVCVPPTDIPDVGRFSMIIDPQGVAFTIFQWKMPAS